MSNEKHETIADIIAKVRKQVKLERKNADGLQKRGDDVNYGIGCSIEEDANYLESIADRLEAAHKRELSKNASKNVADFGQLGDAAKLREALSKFCAYSAVVLNAGMFNREHLEALLNMAKAAIAAPPRNCDLGTAEEQAERYGRHCDKFTSDRMHCETCQCCGKIPFGRCEFAWAQMPYEEGGAE